MSQERIWLDYDRDALDAQYDNRRTVPDYDAVMEEWAQASAAARRACAFMADLRYGPHARARIDFFSASSGGPAVIFFHGGFWRSFDKAGLAFLAPAFMKAGISIALPNYPLAPEADMATIVGHAVEAVRWFAGHARKLDFDPSRLWIAGHSAGAHLAVMSALTVAESGQRIAGCCAISGIYDLEPVRLSYLNDSLKLSPNDVTRFSPLRLGSGAMPLIAAVGDRETDEFRRQTAALVDCWRSGKGGCSHTTLPETDHYEAVRGLARPGNAFFRQLVSAIAPHG